MLFMFSPPLIFWALVAKIIPGGYLIKLKGTVKILPKIPRFLRVISATLALAAIGILFNFNRPPVLEKNINQSNVKILMYHRLSTNPFRGGPGLSVPVSEFEWQMRF